MIIELLILHIYGRNHYNYYLEENHQTTWEKFQKTVLILFTKYFFEDHIYIYILHFRICMNIRLFNKVYK